MIIYSTTAWHQARAKRRRLGEGQGASEERRVTGHERAQLDGVPYRGARDEDLQRIKESVAAENEPRFDLVKTEF